MENWDNEVARQLPNFANGQGIVSGQITNLPLTVKIKFDADLVNSDLGDENFINDVKNWNDTDRTKKKKDLFKKFEKIFKSDQRGLVDTRSILLKAMLISTKITIIFQAVLLFYFFGKDGKIPILIKKHIFCNRKFRLSIFSGWNYFRKFISD